MRQTGRRGRGEPDIGLFPLLIPCHRAAAAGDIKRFDVTDPATFAPKTWLGQQEFSQIAAWLRLHELAFAA